MALRADGFVKAAAGDEAARRELGIFMGRRRAAVGQGQGLAPRDAEDAVRVCRLVIAQDVAVQVHGDIVLYLQPRRNGDVRRQPDHTVGAVRQGGGQVSRRADLGSGGARRHRRRGHRQLCLSLYKFPHRLLRLPHGCVLRQCLHRQQR